MISVNDRSRLAPIVEPHSPTLAGKLLSWVPVIFAGCVVAAWWLS